MNISFINILIAYTFSVLFNYNPAHPIYPTGILNDFVPIFNQALVNKPIGIPTTEQESKSTEIDSEGFTSSTGTSKICDFKALNNQKKEFSFEEYPATGEGPCFVVQLLRKHKLSQLLLMSVFFQHASGNMAADFLKDSLMLALAGVNQPDADENENGITREAKNVWLGRKVFNTIILITLLIVSLLAYQNYRTFKKKMLVLNQLEEKNQEIVAQKEEIQATLNMVEKLNSKLDAQSQALNKSALVAILTHDGKIDYVNDMFTAVSGFRLSELARKDFKSIMSPEQAAIFDDEVIKTVSRRHIWRGELCQLKKNGQRYWIDTVCVPLEDDDNDGYKIYLVQFDITRRIEIEQKLTEKNTSLHELNQLKNKIFSIVSHDFRGPLKSLMGTLALLKKGAISAEEMKDLSESLLDKLENTYSFLDNMLNWSKSQIKGLNIKPTAVNIHAVCDELIKLLQPQAEKKGQKILNEADQSLLVVADMEMIKSVLRNLISNALKFSYENSKITIEAFRKNEQAVISVIDTGTGIEENQIREIFNLENYSTAGTANELGAGLGLILCREFVEQNHGEIWVETEKGKGSTFSFSLPLAKT